LAATKVGYGKPFYSPEIDEMQMVEIQRLAENIISKPYQD
jgi:hypothetical protein